MYRDGGLIPRRVAPSSHGFDVPLALGTESRGTPTSVDSDGSRDWDMGRYKQDHGGGCSVRTTMGVIASNDS